jgi:hypothetical protein
MQQLTHVTKQKIEATMIIAIIVGGRVDESAHEP